MYGRTIYKVNLINTRTGMYYNSASLWFDTMNEAKEYILKNDLIWFDMNNSYNAMINIVHHRTVWNGLKRFETYLPGMENNKQSNTVTGRKY